MRFVKEVASLEGSVRTPKVYPASAAGVLRGRMWWLKDKCTGRVERCMYTRTRLVVFGPAREGDQQALGAYTFLCSIVYHCRRLRTCLRLPHSHP